mmetsp:Transcript_21252/g.35318  ORF Transcript_21252/g.35318 Transcript_21252/m.35318 type:complete len:112 (+) Transcript_21252:852-1187(+)
MQSLPQSLYQPILVKREVQCGTEWLLAILAAVVSCGPARTCMEVTLTQQGCELQWSTQVSAAHVQAMESLPQPQYLPTRAKKVAQCGIEWLKAILAAAVFSGPALTCMEVT